MFRQEILTTTSRFEKVMTLSFFLWLHHFIDIGAASFRIDGITRSWSCHDRRSNCPLGSIENKSANLRYHLCMWERIRLILRPVQRHHEGFCILWFYGSVLCVRLGMNSHICHWSSLFIISINWGRKGIDIQPVAIKIKMDTHPGSIVIHGAWTRRRHLWNPTFYVRSETGENSTSMTNDAANVFGIKTYW